MSYRILADLVFIIHFLFIVFLIFGVFLVLKWRWLAWLHVPVLLWGLLITWAGCICPLTPLEVRLRQIAGQEGFEGGFIEHYLVSIIYPAALTPLIHILAGVLLFIANVIIYGIIVRRGRMTAKQ